MDHVHCDKCRTNTDVGRANITGKCKVASPYRKKEVIRFICRCGEEVESFVHK